MKGSHQSPWSAVLALLYIGLVIPAPVHAADGSPLVAGDYAAYTIGVCEREQYLYPPFFEIEDAEDPGDQIQMWSRACSVTLRWEVLSIQPGLAEIQIFMDGWRYGFENGKKYMYVGSQTWSLPDDDPFHAKTVEILHTRHTVRLDLNTLDATTLEGTYLGRWGFLIAPSEVASGRAEVVRNWYRGTSVEANVTVTKDLALEWEVGLQRAFGTETFIKVATWPTKIPFPDDLGRYLFSTSGGWNELRPASRVHDAVTSLLLVSQSDYYDDLLFNLYGIIWLRDFAPFPGGIEYGGVTISLVDTNLIQLPGPPDDDQDPPPDGDVGDGDTPGDSGNGQDQDPGGVVLPGVEWPTIVLFMAAAVTVVVALLAYRRPRVG